MRLIPRDGALWVLDVVAEKIMCVEVLDRVDVRQKLLSVLTLTYRRGPMAMLPMLARSRCCGSNRKFRPVVRAFPVSPRGSAVAKREPSSPTLLPLLLVLSFQFHNSFLFSGRVVAAFRFQLVLPAQPVDATPSNQLIRLYFPWKTDLFGWDRSTPSQGSIPADLT